jgi:hypothetical protein
MWNPRGIKKYIVYKDCSVEECNGAFNRTE